MAFTVTHTHGVAQIAFAFGSANAMGEQFLAEFETALDETTSAKALVLIGRGEAFSAGLDLPLLLMLDERAVRRTMTVFSRLMERLFALPIPTDFRVAASGKSKLGMNDGRRARHFLPELCHVAASVCAAVYELALGAARRAPLRRRECGCFGARE